MSPSDGICQYTWYGQTFDSNQIARHMRRVHHDYYCHVNKEYFPSATMEGRRTLQSARAVQLGEEAQTEMSAEDELECGNDSPDLPDALDLVDDEAEIVEHGHDFADLPAQEKLVGKKGEEQFRFRRRAYASLPAMFQYIKMPVRQQRDEEDRQRQTQLQDDALPPDHGVQEIGTFDKALLRNRVTSIACIRMVERDKTIGWTPGLTEITYGAGAVCNFDAFFLTTLRIHGVRALVATVLRDTDVSNPKTVGPLQRRFEGQRSQQA
ncbi:hypothetical protein FN846DRAFT_907849 [Sphaerosporella brunnea]|uniref:Uncharacterized protein n=1 Tax=Sphaerosporella brunnea TaxID=1250544 RepID=A0A5J5EV01_9PEZI|nr:hypothetical protein FN846DRAFT_907849 [Sphaerosporella brunnea]